MGCHFLLQYIKVKSESEVAQLCLTLCDPVDYSLPGSFVHGIFQARVLEWVAIAFSERVIQDLTIEQQQTSIGRKYLNRVRLFATPWTVAHQAPSSMGFSRLEYWSGLPFPSPKWLGIT